MSADSLLRAGDIVVITSGDYSDYGINGLVRVLVRLDVAKERAEWRAAGGDEIEPDYCTRCGKPRHEHNHRLFTWTYNGTKRSDMRHFCADGAQMAPEHGDDAFVGWLRRKGLVVDVDARWVHDGELGARP